MTCPNCKQANSDEAIHCINCGTRLRDQLTPRKGVKCPNGHLMDPGWKSCPYCDPRSGSQPGQSADSPKNAPRSSNLGETSISGGGDKLDKTRVMPGIDAKAASIQPGKPGRKARIVGALINYNWNKQGTVFYIYEGKNYIGRGKSSEGDLCDVHVPEDDQMSREHALIHFLDGFTLSDKDSSTGTWMGEKRIKEVELGPAASFRTGQTDWRFVSFVFESAATATPKPKPIAVKVEESEADRRKPD